MPTSRWNHPDKAAFFRLYVGAFFPLLEGEHSPESMVAACEEFLRHLRSGTHIELTSASRLPAGAGHPLRIARSSGMPKPIQRIENFFLDALTEKLRRR